MRKRFNPQRSKKRRRRRPRKKSCYMLNEAIRKNAYKFLICIDEVGWGCIAGPLVVGWTVVPVDVDNPGLKDSKRYTTEKARVAACEVSKDWVLNWGVVVMPVMVVQDDPQKALLAAFKEAVTVSLPNYPEDSLIVIDGRNRAPNVSHPQMVIPKGDDLVGGISAASIIAKVYRDDLMVKLGEEFPEYGFGLNKGYGTPEHIKAIKRYGITEHHRLNTAPVKLALEKMNGQKETNRR